MNDITQLSTLYSNAIARAEKAEEALRVATVQVSRGQLSLGDMPSYGNCSADDMLAAVADAIFGDRDSGLLRLIDTARPVGHQMVPTINFNSLNRIISAFHRPPPPPVRETP